MNKTWMAVAACMLVMGTTACAKTDTDDDVTADTSLVPGTETVEMSVPATDTVVTTTETHTDTIEGEARDSVR